MLLSRWQNGDASALDRLMPLVYEELRRAAASQLRHERGNHTLQPTALVHETFFRLFGQDSSHWNDRAHFFALASQMMRRILVDHARAKHAQKRGGELTIVSLDEVADESAARELELVALDDALRALAEFDERQARIVEIRFFGGLTIEETAEAIGLSPATVKREWTLAKAWLRREIASRIQT